MEQPTEKKEDQAGNGIWPFTWPPEFQEQSLGTDFLPKSSCLLERSKSIDSAFFLCHSLEVIDQVLRISSCVL